MSHNGPDRVSCPGLVLTGPEPKLLPERKTHTAIITAAFLGFSVEKSWRIFPYFWKERNDTTQYQIHIFIFLSLSNSVNGQTVTSLLQVFFLPYYSQIHFSKSLL